MELSERGKRTPSQSTAPAASLGLELGNSCPIYDLDMIGWNDISRSARSKAQTAGFRPFRDSLPISVERLNVTRLPAEMRTGCRAHRAVA